MKILCVLCFLSILDTKPVYSQDTLNVPAKYLTIQSAIDSAQTGDLVLVDEGTYFENINFKGKAITVASYFIIYGDSTHISNTIIDGSQPSHPDTGSVVVFYSGEDTTSVLCGFTITGGTGTYLHEYPHWLRSGGGIDTDSSGAKIINNIITGNTAIQISTGIYNVGGGGISVNSFNKNIIIKNNIIKNNYVGGARAFGAGIALWSEAYSLVSSNIIINNKSVRGTASGGGIHMGIGQHLINNNYIYNNSAIGSGTGGGGGGISSTQNSATFKNNLIVQNEGTWGGGMNIWTMTNLSSMGATRNRSDDKIDISNSKSFDPVVINNTILYNNSSFLGGGIRNYNTPTQFLNNIVWGNNGWGSFDQIYGDMMTVLYSDIEGGFDGTGNIDKDPLFVGTGDHSFSLSNGSPCIDSGDPDTIYNDPEDPNNPGFALWPAMGTLRNDMGAYGGPNAASWNIFVTAIEDDDTEDFQTPNEYELAQNYPNPFNPSTTIQYSIKERSPVELVLYDILGREAKVLVNEEQDAGYYKVNFNAKSLASGIYFYRIQAGSFVETKKMIFLK